MSIGVERRAYGDESFLEAAGGGFYVLAASVFESDLHETARAAMRQLRGRRHVSKLHWNEMDRQERRTAVKTVVGLKAFHIAAVGVPVPPRRQERARSRCLRALVSELHSYGVVHLLLESRTPVLDARDVRTVAGARFDLPKDSSFRVDHVPGHAEPLCWAADIVSGAVRAQRDGQDDFSELLADLLYEIDIDTGC